MRSRIAALLLAVACSLTMGATVVAAPASPAVEARTVEPAARYFANCTALNRKHPQGVGRPKAQNRVNGRPTGDRNHTKNRALYNRNSHLDRDKDGVACER